MAGTSKNESLRVRHPVFRPVLAPGQSHQSVHLLLVTLQESDVVSVDQEIGYFQLAPGGSLKRTLSFSEAVQKK